MNLGKYIFEGMKQYLENYLARESFMLSLMFRGRLDEYDLPPYLDRDCLQKIIKRMDKVEIRTENILEFMETVEENSFTKFSLSDVPSFLDQEMFERLLDGIVRSGAPGARFCIRQFLTDHVIPDRFETTVVREPKLEERLSKRDRSFAYRFIVGRVKKGG
jgi:S-adenosylmethionine-diacylglycerol 3-amino-3-carboxypropyl transferase